MHRSPAITVSTIVLLLGLTACSSAPGSGSDAGTVEVSDETVLLDVRTAGEFAAGHLDGAQLLDFNACDVAAAIPNLDPDAEYLLYCRSGNRAGQAIALMEQAGFTSVTNLGSLEEAAEATKLSIVK